MTEGFSGLPDRPVTETDTQALHHHRAITFCHPVYRLSEDPESIVVIALGKGDRAHFLVYNPVDERWEQLVATDIPEAITDDVPFSPDEVDERLWDLYDEAEIEPAGYPTDPVRGAVGGFPAEPLTDEQLDTIQRQHPMIGGVMPLVESRGDGRTIALILFFDDFLGERRITTAVGYDPDTGEWQLIDSVESSDPDLDRALGRLEDAYANWVATRYTMDDIDPIEDPEAALRS